jgi:hypothetical protein
MPVGPMALIWFGTILLRLSSIVPYFQAYASKKLPRARTIPADARVTPFEDDTPATPGYSGAVPGSSDFPAGVAAGARAAVPEAAAVPCDRVRASATSLTN